MAFDADAKPRAFAVCGDGEEEIAAADDAGGVEIAVRDDVFDIHEDVLFAAVIGEGFGFLFVYIDDVDDVGFVEFAFAWEAGVYGGAEGFHFGVEFAHAMAGGGGVDGDVFGNACIAQTCEALLRQEFIADEHEVCVFGV